MLLGHNTYKHSKNVQIPITLCCKLTTHIVQISVLLNLYKIK